MRVVISQRHLSLNERLAEEANRLAKNFKNNEYSKIEDIDALLLKRDISVEEKKRILLKKLHSMVIGTFSLDKKRLSKKTFECMKKRLHIIRKIITKLRSINYYLETAFLQELSISKIKAGDKSLRLRQRETLAKGELGALEYTSYKLIGKVVALDRKLLKGYSGRGASIIKKEKIEAKNLGSILSKQSELLEHLEAKLPPPKAATIALAKEPVFTHWVARIFALLAYVEHLCKKESIIFSELKGSKAKRNKINKKISHLAAEKSKLIRIMEEKLASMKTYAFGNELKRELHNLAATANL